MQVFLFLFWRALWAGLYAASPRSPDSYRDRCGLFAAIPRAVSFPLNVLLSKTTTGPETQALPSDHLQQLQRLPNRFNLLESQQQSQPVWGLLFFHTADRRIFLDELQYAMELRRGVII